MRETKYPAAERMALDLEITDADTLASLTERWRTEYARRVSAQPSEPEQAAAARVLEQRLAGAPPLPPSASGVHRRLPDTLIGVPD